MFIIMGEMKDAIQDFYEAMKVLSKNNPEVVSLFQKIHGSNNEGAASGYKNKGVNYSGYRHNSPMKKLHWTACGERS